MTKIIAVLLFSISYFFVASADASIKIDVSTCSNVYPSGDKDSAAGLQSCISQAGSEAAIYFPPGNYTIGSTIVISENNVTLYADARATAKLNFSGCGDALRFSKGAATIFNSGVLNLWINGDGHCVQNGIRVIDGSWVTVEKSQLSGFADVSEASSGIITNGREGFYLRNVDISANNPIVLAKNPNHPFLDIDHTHFENLYTRIVSKGRIAHWTVTLRDPAGSPVVMSNLTIDGQNAMTGGCGILSWVAPTAIPTSVSTHLKLANIRHEQSTPIASCVGHIDIELPATRPLQELIIDNVRFEGPTSGTWIAGDTAIYLRSVDSISIRDTSYPNSSANALSPANFINAQGAKWIELSNNYLNNPYASRVLTSPQLVWKAGPFTGKGCCAVVGERLTPTTDSGTLGE